MEAFGGHGVCRPVTVPVGAGIGMKRTLIRSVADGGVGRVWRRGAKGRRIWRRPDEGEGFALEPRRRRVFMDSVRLPWCTCTERIARASMSSVVCSFVVRRSSFVVLHVGDASRTLASGDRRPRVSGAYGAGRPLQQASDNDTDSDTVNDAMRLTCFPFPAPPPSDSTFVPSIPFETAAQLFKRFSSPTHNAATYEWGIPIQTTSRTSTRRLPKQRKLSSWRTRQSRRSRMQPTTTPTSLSLSPMNSPR